MAGRRSRLSRFFTHLEEVLFPEPEKCVFCAKVTETAENGLCEDCEKQLKRLTGSRCAVCGRQVDPGMHRCLECAHRTVYYEDCASSFRYHGPCADMIMKLKYHGDRAAARWLAREMSRTAQQRHFHADLIVPVPIHIRKKFSRGYNQSVWLAKEIGRSLDMPVALRAAKRVRHTPTQTRLSAEQRRENVSGAFRFSDPSKIRNKTVLLVDDVMTTGATAGECAKALRAGGAAKVLVLTAALSVEAGA